MRLISCSRIPCDGLAPGILGLDRSLDLIWRDRASGGYGGHGAVLQCVHTT